MNTHALWSSAISDPSGVVYRDVWWTPLGCCHLAYRFLCSGPLNFHYWNKTLSSCWYETLVGSLKPLHDWTHSDKNMILESPVNSMDDPDCWPLYDFLILDILKCKHLIKVSIFSLLHLEAGTNTFYLFICASEVAYEFYSLSLSLSLSTYMAIGMIRVSLKLSQKLWLKMPSNNTVG
jgi:hypothetical protein